MGCRFCAGLGRSRIQHTSTSHPRERNRHAPLYADAPPGSAGLIGVQVVLLGEAKHPDDVCTGNAAGLEGAGDHRTAAMAAGPRKIDRHHGPAAIPLCRNATLPTKRSDTDHVHILHVQAINRGVGLFLPSTFTPPWEATVNKMTSMYSPPRRPPAVFVAEANVYYERRAVYYERCVVRYERCALQY